MTKKEIAKGTSPQRASGVPPKSEVQDPYTNKVTLKEKSEKKSPKPQADQVLNSGLNTENDI